MNEAHEEAPKNEVNDECLNMDLNLSPPIFPPSPDRSSDKEEGRAWGLTVIKESNESQEVGGHTNSPLRISPSPKAKEDDNDRVVLENI